MKLKTVGGVVGVVNSVIFGGATYGFYYMFSRMQYDRIVDIMTGDYPMGYKITAASFPVASSVGLAGASVYFVDGLVDTVKGTHHYFCMQLCKNS